MTTVDLLVQMLAETREELRKAKDNLRDAYSAQMQAVADKNRARSERDFAEAKIEEWFDYSQSWQPLIPNKRRHELKPPKAYAREIPF